MAGVPVRLLPAGLFEFDALRMIQSCRLKCFRSFEHAGDRKKALLSGVVFTLGSWSLFGFWPEL